MCGRGKLFSTDEAKNTYIRVKGVEAILCPLIPLGWPTWPIRGRGESMRKVRKVLKDIVVILMLLYLILG